MKKSPRLHKFLLCIFFLAGIIQAADLTIPADKTIISGNGLEIQKNIRVIKSALQVKDRFFTMHSDRGVFYTNSQTLKAVSNVKLYHEKFTLSCDEISAFLNDNRVIASGRPHVVEKKKILLGEKKIQSHVEMTSKIIQYEKQTNILSAFSNVKIERFLETTAPTTVISCEKMYLYQEKKYIEASDNVSIDDTQFEAGAKKAYYFREGRERLELEGDAWAREKNQLKPNQVRGKKIVYFFDTQKIHVVGSSEASLRYESDQ